MPGSGGAAARGGRGGGARDADNMVAPADLMDGAKDGSKRAKVNESGDGTGLGV